MTKRIPITKSICIAALAALLALAACGKAADAAAPEAEIAPVEGAAAVEAAAQDAARAASPVEEAPSRAAAEEGFRLGGTGPAGGLIYYIDGADLYEALPPGRVVNAADALPAGWIAADLEDLGLINDSLQKTGAADYKEFWYISANKVGGKNQYYRMTDGQKTTDAVSGRKIGVRVSKAPEGALVSGAVVSGGGAAQGGAAAQGGTQAVSGGGAAQTGTPSAPQPIPAGAKYAAGDAGPNGGIIFAYSNGKYLEITKPENAVLVYKDPARVKANRAEYDALGSQIKALEPGVEAKKKTITDPMGDMIRAGNKTGDHSYRQSEEWKALEEQLSHVNDEIFALQRKQYALNDELRGLLRTYDPSGNTNMEAAAPSGWRTATAPDLIAAYNALKKTGKANFGNALYLSSSTFTEDYRGRTTGTDYTRGPVALGGALENSPLESGAVPPDGPFPMPEPDALAAYFPGARIILAGGGGGSDQFYMDMGDGAILALDPYFQGLRDLGYKGRTAFDLRLVFVREFGQ